MSTTISVLGGVGLVLLGMKTMSPRRDRKSETTTCEKWPQKTALLLASYQLRVSEDWVVETGWIELAAHPPVIERVSSLSQEREFSLQRLRSSIYGGSG